MYHKHYDNQHFEITMMTFEPRTLDNSWNTILVTMKRSLHVIKGNKHFYTIQNV